MKLLPRRVSAGSVSAWPPARPSAWALALALVVSVALGSTGCGAETPEVPTSLDQGASGEPTGELVVFAAASLTDVFGDLAAAFEAANPGVEVTLSLAGSSTIREQVLDGAPADVIATAGQPIMAELEVADALRGPPSRFATNRMVLAVPAGNPAGVRGLEAAADPELLVGLCDAAVPCGALAREALASAGVSPSVDTAEPDVRALLAKLAAGELDLGLVYATDVVASAGAVESVDGARLIGAELVYPAAEVANATNPVAARAFLAFLTSESARSILTRHGFGP